ncbi:hypothetical protein ACWGKQ_28575 [Streptomyces sp. NPDC054770]
MVVPPPDVAATSTWMVTHLHSLNRLIVILPAWSATADGAFARSGKTAGAHRGTTRDPLAHPNAMQDAAEEQQFVVVVGTGVQVPSRVRPVSGHLFAMSIDGSPVGSAGVTSVAYVR